MKKMEMFTACPLCGNPGVPIHCSHRDMIVRKCRACGMMFQGPDSPAHHNRELIERIYARYIGHTPQHLRLNRSRILKMEALLGRRFRGLKVLEVGAGNGALGHMLSMAGAYYTGLEPMELCRLAAVKQFPELTGRLLPEKLRAGLFPERSFDMVVATDTLEHVDDPLEAAKTMGLLLKTGGKAYFEVPNESLFRLKGFVRVALKMYGGGYPTNPDHASLFTLATFRLLLEKAGLREEKLVRDSVLGNPSRIKIAFNGRPPFPILAASWFFKFTKLHLLLEQGVLAAVVSPGDVPAATSATYRSHSWIAANASPPAKCSRTNFAMHLGIASRRPKSVEPLRITVIIPARNSRGTIAGCLASLVGQVRPPDGVVVVDDHSEDGTSAVVEAFAKKLPLLLLRNDSHRGAGYARHSGAKRAEPGILAFLDSDCVAPPDWLRKIENSFSEDPSLGGVGGRYSHLPKDGQSIFEIMSLMEENYAFEYFVENPSAAAVPGGNVAYRSSVWDQRSQKELVYFKKMASGEDSVVNGELRQIAPFKYDPSLFVTHQSASAEKYFKKHVLRGKSGLLIKLYRLPSSPLVGLGEFWRLFISAAAFVLVLTSLCFIPLYPGAACGVAAAAWALHVYCGRGFIGFVRRSAALDLLRLSGLRGLLGLRLLLWCCGCALALKEWGGERLSFAYQLLLSALHFFVPGRISKLFFFVTSRCNARCDFCFNLDNVKNSAARAHSELSLEEIGRMTRRLGRMPFLTISGGEPFLRDDLPQIIELFHRDCRTQWVSIPSNGVLSGRILEAVQDILTACPSLFLTVSISIDALNGEHDLSRRLPDGFKRIDETMQALGRIRERHTNLRLQIATPVTDADPSHIRDVAEYCRTRFRYDDHLYYLVRDRNSRVTLHEPGLLATYKDVIVSDNLKMSGTKPRALWSFVFRTVLDGVCDEAVENLGARFERQCRSTRKFLTLYDNGDISPCEVLGSVKYANLRDSDYDLYRLIRRRAVREYVESDIIGGRCWCDWACAYSMNLLYDPVVMWRSALRAVVRVLPTAAATGLGLTRNPSASDAGRGIGPGGAL